MLTLPLEPTDDRANPAFKSASSCEQWIAKLQFTNIHAVHNSIRTQLEELNRFPMRALERFNTLEKVRETVLTVQTDYAKKLIAKKLPLATEEFAVLNSILGLWKQMLTGYQRCLQDFIDGDKQLDKYGATLCHRLMLYGSLQIIEHLRSGYEFDGELWQQLHALYSFTEGNGLHHDKIKDTVHSSNVGITCHALYAKILLVCYAKPAELSRAQLQLLDRWLTSWAEVITIERRCILSKGDAPPLAVDLNSKKGLQELNQITQSDHVRYLTMVPLSKLLRVKSILLQQGQSPLQLDLGEDFFGVDCVTLLNRLLHLWCESSNDRSAERHNVTTSATLAIGFDLIYAQLSGKPIKTTKPSKPNADINTDAHKQIATVGHQFASSSPSDTQQLENWTIENESILGARVLRVDSEGERIGNNQLIALRTPDAKSFMLGTVSWRSVTLTGKLRMGIQYLPGVAQHVTLSENTKVGSPALGKHITAILLPEMPNIKTPASLLVPREAFQANRVCELNLPKQEKINIKMGFSVLSGADFERISFTQEQKKT